MTNVIDWILDLFRDPVRANGIHRRPRPLDGDRRRAERLGRSGAGRGSHRGARRGHPRRRQPGRTACSRQWPRPTASPSPRSSAGVGPGDRGVQQQRHPEPQRRAEPQRRPRCAAGRRDLDFGDITFGDKTNEHRHRRRRGQHGDNAGDIDTTNVEGDGNVVGDDNDERQHRRHRDRRRLTGHHRRRQRRRQQPTRTPRWRHHPGQRRPGRQDRRHRHQRRRRRPAATVATAAAS